MPGPTTEVINDDLKGLRDDFHKLAIEIREANHQIAQKAAQDTHQVELDVREIATQVKGILGAIRLLIVLTITSIAGSIWWGATLTADMKNLEIRAAERSRDIDERFKTIDTRFDRLETAISKVIEQTKPRP